MVKRTDMVVIDSQSAFVPHPCKVGVWMKVHPSVTVTCPHCKSGPGVPCEYPQTEEDRGHVTITLPWKSAVHADRKKAFKEQGGLLTVHTLHIHLEREK